MLYTEKSADELRAVLEALIKAGKPITIRTTRKSEQGEWHLIRSEDVKRLKLLLKALKKFLHLQVARDNMSLVEAKSAEYAIWAAQVFLKNVNTEAYDEKRGYSEGELDYFISEIADDWRDCELLDYLR